MNVKSVAWSPVCGHIALLKKISNSKLNFTWSQGIITAKQVKATSS